MELYTEYDYLEFVKTLNVVPDEVVVPAFTWGIPELNNPEVVLQEIKLYPEDFRPGGVTASQTLYWVKKTYYNAQTVNVVGNLFSFAAVLNCPITANVYISEERFRYLKEVSTWGYLVVPLCGVTKKNNANLRYKMNIIGMSKPQLFGAVPRFSNLRDLIIMGKPTTTNYINVCPKITEMLRDFYFTLWAEGELDNANS